LLKSVVIEHIVILSHEINQPGQFLPIYILAIMTQMTSSTKLFLFFAWCLLLQPNISDMLLIHYSCI